MTRSPLARRSLGVLGTCALGAILALSTGCRGWSEVAYAQTFPERVPVGDTLPIQVVRDGTRITITNTTASPLPESRLWLNKWFSRPTDRLDIGETVTFNLREFRDEFSEPFRAGGFWATDAGDPVVTAHLELNGSMRGLVVVTKRGG